MLVGEHVYRGSGPAELVEAHPSLTLGQAYGALAYYYDHLDELDTELAERTQYATEMESAGNDALRARALTEQYRQRVPRA
jgi:hypothetical protein